MLFGKRGIQIFVAFFKRPLFFEPYETGNTL